MERFYFWLTTGLILLGAEFFVPGFVVFFFGIAACAVSIISFFCPGAGIVAEIILFLLSAALLLLLSRRFLPGAFKSKSTYQEPVPENILGSSATAVTRITPEFSGKVVFNEELWNATSSEHISTGELCRIVSYHNGNLIVEKNK